MSVERRRVAANGIDQHVYVAGPDDGAPVLLVHGNCSSAVFWLPLLRHVPPDLRIVAPDLRGYGETEPAGVDARRGLRDFADDLAPLLDLFDGPPVVVGHSMGGGIAMQLAVDQPGRLAALLLEAPLSPYGFGGTRDLVGTPNSPDFAGTGAGAVNPEFVARLAAKDRTADDLASPRSVMHGTYVADPESFGDDEEALLDSVLSTVVGDDNYPGDAAPSEGWPGAGPGTRGVLNAMSPRFYQIADALVALHPKPPIAWVRGDADVIVSDGSLLDLANLGQLGLVPGWPGAETHPAQPMVGQTRAVLERYGPYTETVFAGCGHSPHLERPAEFVAVLTGLLRR